MPQKGFTNGENNHDLLNFVKELIDGKTKVSTADGYGLVSFLKKDKGHIVYFGKRIKSKIEGKQHFAAVKSIKQLLAAAIHVEEIQNKKLNKKPNVKSYHRFYIPVRIGDTIKTIRLVAEEQKGELSFNPKKVNLYDVIIENRNSRAANEDRLSEKTYSLGQTTRVSDTVSIREMLAGVKDYQGEPYIKQEKAAVNTYGQESSNTINAQIETYVDGKRVISIFETANESTFAHEMSHMFLMDLEDLAKIDETSAKELETVNSWAEWERGAAAEYKGTPWAAEFSAREQQIIDSQRAGDHDTADKLKREWRQERFARAFELYLRDGKAPTKGLKEVFRKFKKFLRTIYIAFIGDGGKPSLQVQRIMDRMIATEDEIRAAELDDRYKDVTKAGGEKLFSETEEETYKRWYTEASEEAKEKLLAETMTELQGKKNEEFNNCLARERDRKEKELQQETVYLTERAVAAAGGDMNIALNWYDSLADFDKAMQETPSLDEALDSYMTEYTKALDAELIDAYLSEEAVNKAMGSTAARAKLENYKAAAFAAKQGLIKKIDHKAQYAMQSVEEHINSLPDDIELKLDKFNAKVVALTKALARLRTSTKWNSEDYNAIEKMVRAATKADLLESFKDFEAKQKEAAKADKENLRAVMKATEGRLKFFRETAQRSIQAKPLAEACNYKGYLREAKKNAGRVQAMIRAKRWDMIISQRA